MPLEEFIIAHADADPADLLLHRDRWPEIDMEAAVNAIGCRRRLRTKAPEWAACAALRYPDRLCAEQCSSTETARYKAALAARIHGGPLRVADLTGGLGVDSWALSEVADEVLYCECRADLAAAAAHNFPALGRRNITVRCATLAPGRVADALGDFAPDLLCLDPARRAEDGRKVFRLEDGRPDVTALLPELLAAAPHLLLKLSPMADVDRVAAQLTAAVGGRRCLRAVHVVAAARECKELLLWLDRDWDGDYTVTAYESGASFTFRPLDEQRCEPVFASGPEMLSAAPFLFVPGKALAKAGAFGLIGERFGLLKVGRSTHLYLSSRSGDPGLDRLGRFFRIREAVLLGNRALRALGRRFPAAEVTARNLPLTSEALRHRLGIRTGGPVHIYGCRADFAGAPSCNILFVTEPL